jgi:hypothetical protein
VLRPIVDPGDPEGSILYQALSLCDPPDPAVGAPLRHMPLNAPVLLPDSLVAMVRAWIENLPPE